MQPDPRLAWAMILKLGVTMGLIITASMFSPPRARATTEPTASPSIDAVVATVTKDVQALQERMRQSATDSTGNAIPAQLSSLSFEPTDTCPRCNTGIALAEAALASRGDSTMQSSAIADMNALLSWQQQPNGSLASMPDGGELASEFFADNLGVGELMLAPYLSSDMASRWTSAVASAADELKINKNYVYYTNGNVNIGDALTAALAFRLTGNALYSGYFREAWAFAQAPNQVRWPGSGFIVTREPSLADGSDGAGYFTENAVVGSDGLFGYDPDYTMLQLDQLSRLLLVTRDPSVLRVANMVANQLLLRVDTTTWTLNASNGSRHTGPNIIEWFDTSGLSVLAAAGRSDFQPYLAPQLTNAIARNWLRFASQSNIADRNYYALGMNLSSILWSITPQVGASQVLGSAPLEPQTPPISSVLRAQFWLNANRGGLLRITARPLRRSGRVAVQEKTGRVWRVIGVARFSSRGVALVQIGKTRVGASLRVVDFRNLAPPLIIHVRKLKAP